MANISLDTQVFRRQLDRLEREFAQKPRVIERLLRTTSNRTMRGIKTDISKGIRERVAIKKQDIDPHIATRGATRSNPSALVTLSESERLNLKFFGARQTKRGVSYKIDKRSGRKRIAGAFIVEKFGDRVFARTGSSRFPITQKRGISAWGAYVKNPDLDRRIRREGSERFRRELASRIDRELMKRGAT